jgi:hypothetical protein
VSAGVAVSLGVAVSAGVASGVEAAGEGSLTLGEGVSEGVVVSLGDVDALGSLDGVEVASTVDELADGSGDGVVSAKANDVWSMTRSATRSVEMERSRDQRKRNPLRPVNSTRHRAEPSTASVSPLTPRRPGDQSQPADRSPAQ